MKKSNSKVCLALLLSTSLLFSCKKEKTIEPCNSSNQVNNNCNMRITINNTGSTTSSKLMGRVLAISDSDTIFDKELNYIYPSSFSLDTTLNLTASSLEVQVFTLSMKNTGGSNFDYDNIADGNVKVYLDNDLKINAFGSNIIIGSKIK